MYKVPSTWSLYGTSGDQSSFALPDHSPLNPHLVIFDRKTPQISAGGVSVPSFRVRVIKGITNPDGGPVQTRVTNDVTIRWPNSADASLVKADSALLGSILSDVDFTSAAIDQQLLPTEVDSP